MLKDWNVLENLLCHVILLQRNKQMKVSMQTKITIKIVLNRAFNSKKAIWKLIKGESLPRNCGAASLGEYNRVIKSYQLSWWCKIATAGSFKADILSVNPLSITWMTKLPHFIVVYLATKPLIRSKPEGDLVVIETSIYLAW